MNELQKFIYEQLKKGLSEADVLFKVAADETLKAYSDEDIAKELTATKKVICLEQTAKTAEAEATKQAETDALIQKGVDEALKKIKVDNPIGVGTPVKVKECENEWKKDMFKALKLVNKKRSDSGLTEKEAEEFNKARLKITQRNQEKLGITKDLSESLNVTNSNEGTDLIPIEFDTEIDKLVYKESQLLDFIKIRRGTEKTDINGIGTFTFSGRSDDEKALTTKQLATTKDNVVYKDAGAIVNVTNRMMQGSAYNVIGELMELAKDAKIQYLEPLITTGRITGAGDHFNGMWFTSGVNSVQAKNGAGNASGKIISADLTNAFAACPSQSRLSPKRAFIMDTREALVLENEKAEDGHKLKDVVMENGQYIHKPTGTPIILVDTMLRTLNGTTSHTGGSNVPVIFGAMNRFRFYQNGSMRVKTSEEFAFAEDATAFRFIINYKFAIPSNSLTSFVLLTGLKNKLVA